MLTLKQVNKAIAALGFKDELVKGNGYYYFSGEDADQWFTSSIGVYTLNQIPDVNYWVARYLDFRNEPRNIERNAAAKDESQ